MKKQQNFLLVLFIGLQLLVVGCHSQSTIYNDIIVAEKNDLDQNQEQRNAELNAILNRYIYVGMPLSVALNMLKKQSFDITESTIDGYRDYPDGTLNRYDSAPGVLARVRKSFANDKFHYKAERFNKIELIGSSVVITLQSDGNRILMAEVYVDHY